LRPPPAENGRKTITKKGGGKEEKGSAKRESRHCHCGNRGKTKKELFEDIGCIKAGDSIKKETPLAARGGGGYWCDGIVGDRFIEQNATRFALVEGDSKLRGVIKTKCQKKTVVMKKMEK